MDHTENTEPVKQEERNPDALGNKRLILGIVLYAIVFLVILLISRIGAINRWFGGVLAVFRPVVIGLVIAYLANPFFRFFERKLLFRMHSVRLRRVLSLLLTYLVLFLIVALLVLLIVPQLYSSGQNFAANFDTYLGSVIEDINALIEKGNALLPPGENGEPAIRLISKENAYQTVAKYWNSLLDSLRKSEISFDTLPRIWDVLSLVASGVTNAIFGIFVSIYLLASKEKRYAQVLKFRRAMFSDSFNGHLTHIVTVADRSFGGFLRGKILDSTIVGILTWVMCWIFRIPYAVLVAVIVGITDIIPVVGPFIGVIPTAIIILLTDPIKVIIFLIGILVIQQIDGNIIAPKILGDHTGVSSLCVMIAIILMGGLWGLFGMLVGVPLFATILELTDGWLKKRLHDRGLPDDLENYYAQDAVPAAYAEKAEEPEAVPAQATGSGDLAEIERIQLQTYWNLQKHCVLSDSSEEAFQAFAEEEADLLRAESQPVPDGESSPLPDDGQEAAEISAEPQPAQEPAVSAPKADVDKPENGGDAE